MSCVSRVLVISLHSTSHVTVMISQCVIVLPGMCVTVERQVYCLKGLGTGKASELVVLSTHEWARVEGSLPSGSTKSH